MKFTTSSKFKSNGMTLIELMIALAIGAGVIVGAVSLSNSASSSANSNQLTTDLTALRTSTKGVYSGQGGYGVGSINSVLINGNKVPSTMSVSGTTINHQLNGTVAITGATTNFTIAMTNIPTDVCVSVVTAATGFSQLQIGANAAITTFPVSPTIASTQCSAAATSTLTFTAS